VGVQWGTNGSTREPIRLPSRWDNLSICNNMWDSTWSLWRYSVAGTGSNVMSISLLDGARRQNWIWLLKEEYGKIKISGLFADNFSLFVFNFFACCQSSCRMRMGMEGNWELFDGKWEWGMSSCRWEWESHGNRKEVIEMRGNWYEKSVPAHFLYIADGRGLFLIKSSMLIQIGTTLTIT